MSERNTSPERKQRRVSFSTGLAIILTFAGVLDQVMLHGNGRATAIEYLENYGNNDATSALSTTNYPNQVQEVTHTGSNWVENPNAYTIIDSLDLPDGHKDYLKFTFNCTVKALNAGSQENPATLIGMSVLETGWGTDELSKISHNNFGINGVGDAGTVNMSTREVINGEDAYRIAGFKAYADPCGSHLDMAPMHQRLEQYSDVVACSDTPEHMLNAIQHYADPETCELVAFQGEPLPGGGPNDKVLGHATDPNYISTVLNVIDIAHAEELFLPA